VRKRSTALSVKPWRGWLLRALALGLALSLTVNSARAVAQGSAGTVAAGTAPALSAPSLIDSLVARHSAGELVLAERVPNEASFLELRPELFAAARAWRQQLNPAGATFLLDLALWSLGHEWADGLLLMRMAEEIVTGQSARTTLDSFELLFHRAALVSLIGTHKLVQAEDYFTRLDARLAASNTGKAPGNRLVEPQLLLLRALLDEAWTAPSTGSLASASATVSAGVVAPDDRAMRTRLDKALASFERASQAAEVGNEAAVRRAFVLHRLGRQREALAALDALDTSGAERAVQYWRQLFRGRVLEALNRTDDAQAAYVEAWRIQVGAQTPAVALASLLQRRGDTEEARRWAAQAVAARSNVVDPWWQYWFGDLRWLDIWMSDLRAASSRP
jgi:tetratricopeptide (TPR) repeat protein